MKKLISLCMMWCICLSMWAGKHYTVIVSLDGFRWDYPQMYDTPFFDRMAREGVKATMIPSFPSKTFPNHYTIATGLVPDHHGIVANTFWDPKRQELYKMNNLKTRNDASYYGGEPIWITAQKQGIFPGRGLAGSRLCHTLWYVCGLYFDAGRSEVLASYGSQYV